MKAKKFLKQAVEQDVNSVLHTEQNKTILERLLNAKQTAANKNSATCPDCGNALTFDASFGLFKHTNCEELNCWYKADESGECVDNNEMRAARIAKYLELKY